MTDDSHRYPVGRFTMPGTLTPAHRTAAIEVLAAFPAQFRAAVHGLDAAQLDTPYRDGGWTVRQVVHHVPESHMHAYCRLKFALTEDNPTIKPYEEAVWADLPDARLLPVSVSLLLLQALHERWVALLRALPHESFARTLQHPQNGAMKIDDLLTTYSWHGRHHTAHVTALRDRMGWS